MLRSTRESDILISHTIMEAILMGNTLDSKNSESCVCNGNWVKLITKYKSLFDRNFKDNRTGDVYMLLGIMDGGDDFYFVMASKGQIHLYSCVGSLMAAGFELIEQDDK